MRHALALCAVMGAVLAVPLSATAQNVYRCGDSYSQQPCPGAKAIDVPQAPGTQEQQRAREATARDAKAAEALEKSRLREESRPVSAYIPVKKDETPPASAPGKVEKPYVFTAKAPGEKKSKKDTKKKDAK